MALTFLARSKAAVYARAIGLLKDLRYDFNENNQASRELVRPYQRWHLLIVDEVGLRVRGDKGYSDSDWALFTDLIDYRYAEGHATIFVSNDKPEDALTSLGPSVARRFQETGKVIVAEWKPFTNPREVA